MIEIAVVLWHRAIGRSLCLDDTLASALGEVSLGQPSSVGQFRGGSGFVSKTRDGDQEKAKGMPSGDLVRRSCFALASACRWLDWTIITRLRASLLRALTI